MRLKTSRWTVLVYLGALAWFVLRLRECGYLRECRRAAMQCEPRMAVYLRTRMTRCKALERCGPDVCARPAATARHAPPLAVLSRAPDTVDPIFGCAYEGVWNGRLLYPLYCLRLRSRRLVPLHWRRCPNICGRIFLMVSSRAAGTLPGQLALATRCSTHAVTHAPAPFRCHLALSTSRSMSRHPRAVAAIQREGGSLQR